jgi:hypothetical protein
MPRLRCAHARVARQCASVLSVQADAVLGLGHARRIAPHGARMLLMFHRLLNMRCMLPAECRNLLLPYAMRWPHLLSAATICGAGAFGQLKFESGVHRVQRVPVTEERSSLQRNGGAKASAIPRWLGSSALVRRSALFCAACKHAAAVGGAR